MPLFPTSTARAIRASITARFPTSISWPRNGHSGRLGRSRLHQWAQNLSRQQACGRRRATATTSTARRLTSRRRWRPARPVSAQPILDEGDHRHVSGLSNVPYFGRQGIAGLVNGVDTSAPKGNPMMPPRRNPIFEAMSRPQNGVDPLAPMPDQMHAANGSAAANEHGHGSSRKCSSPRWANRRSPRCSPATTSSTARRSWALSGTPSPHMAGKAACSHR
jgi:hypothetical protein